ncbi:FabD/lysophospholipase-like protein [Zopfia rhizophila CBS 207.26]|uniref:FabD/lysophospholipase-like protein n=1 Tax=Zopfia rhizophila CBS 207.26 TaxID=1314779 RepID=A0A6A6E532_9PEZI|nr:FabD/lysophospholipase-like protein [Zopfia rhizophila CBS 207.26]
MPEHDLRLLTFDSGGVRGLSTLQIMKQLMDTIDLESPLKPCDYFDMIGGTSTSGLIAIMLGQLRMTVDECINAYIFLSDRIFQKQGRRVTIKGWVQGRFDSDELERATKEIIMRQGLAKDALLKDVPDVKFVCATSSETEAGRATSAASSFFNPITLGDFEETFVNGAIGANNPVYKSLLVITTETEKTAEQFSRDKSRLNDTGRYYRFNSQAVFKQMKACADSMSGREYYLQGVPIVNKFIDRPSNIAELEKALLPQRQYRRRKVFVLYGLSGMGKTQLAVKFVRRHHRKFSSVFWLNGRAEDSLKQSFATCAGRIPEGQIIESSRIFSATDGKGRDTDSDEYNITPYLSGADYGSVLITTRLANLEQLGESRRLGKLSKD